MDISNTFYNPGATSKQPLAKEYHGQTSKKCRAKKADSVKFIPQKNSEQQGAKQSEHIKSPEDRTVMEFSKFCSSGFIPNTGSTSSGLPNEPDCDYSPGVISQFCFMMRLCSHSQPELFDEIIQTIKVNIDNEDKTRATLNKLVFLKKYDDIKGIETARNIFTGRVKKAPYSETRALRCRRSARIAPCTLQAVAIMEKTAPDTNKDKLQVEEETNTRPIKRRKLT